MQLKLKLPGNHLDRQQDLWDQLDQNAQQELLQALARVLGKAVDQNNEAHQNEDHEAIVND
jgi:hypothetical protein